MALPPGPRAPATLQTIRLLARPVPFFESARRRYGEPFTARILRAGRLVFISDPPSIKALFGADRENIVAPGRNVVLGPLLGERSLLLLNGPEHLARRKLMLPPFHGERMRAYERVMEEATEREISRWPLNREFRIHPSMQAITLEVIMRAVFGVGEDHRDDLRQRLLAILAATRSPLAIGLTMPVVRSVGAFRRVRRTIAETDEILAAEIAERRADPNLASREDILSLLVAARDENGEGMSDAELRDQLLTLLMAGHETTATALAWAFDLLFRHPEAMERLREEVEGERARVPGRCRGGDTAAAAGSAIRRPRAARADGARRPSAASRDRGDALDLSHPHPRRPLSGALCLPPRALPHRAAGDLQLDPLWWRHPPLHRRRVRPGRDASRASDRAARGRAPRGQRRP